MVAPVDSIEGCVSVRAVLRQRQPPLRAITCCREAARYGSCALLRVDTPQVLRGEQSRREGPRR